jgi:hypothetical protein
MKYSGQREGLSRGWPFAGAGVELTGVVWAARVTLTCISFAAG